MAPAGPAPVATGPRVSPGAMRSRVGTAPVDALECTGGRPGYEQGRVEADGPLALAGVHLRRCDVGGYVAYGMWRPYGEVARAYLRGGVGVDSALGHLVGWVRAASGTPRCSQVPARAFDVTWVTENATLPTFCTVRVRYIQVCRGGVKLVVP